MICQKYFFFFSKTFNYGSSKKVERIINNKSHLYLWPVMHSCQVMGWAVFALCIQSQVLVPQLSDEPWGGSGLGAPCFFSDPSIDGPE